MAVVVSDQASLMFLLMKTCWCCDWKCCCLYWLPVDLSSLLLEFCCVFLKTASCPVCTLQSVYGLERYFLRACQQHDQYCCLCCVCDGACLVVVKKTFSWKPFFVWQTNRKSAVEVAQNSILTESIFCPFFFQRQKPNNTVDNWGSRTTVDFEWNLQLVHDYLLLLPKKRSDMEKRC